MTSPRPTTRVAPAPMPLSARVAIAVLWGAAAWIAAHGALWLLNAPDWTFAPVCTLLAVGFGASSWAENGSDASARRREGGRS